MANLIGFPRTVTEKAARTVAAGVVVLALLTAATGAFWLTIPLAYGFWARVLTGPRLSPLGQLATRVIAPRLGAPKVVPGPPKRFAQAMGVAMSTGALVLGVATAAGVGLTGRLLLAIVAVAAYVPLAGGRPCHRGRLHRQRRRRRGAGPAAAHPPDAEDDNREHDRCQERGATGIEIGHGPDATYEPVADQHADVTRDARTRANSDSGFPIGYRD